MRGTPIALCCVAVLCLPGHLRARSSELEVDALQDDDLQAVEHLRKRLEAETRGATYGILLVTGPVELAWSSITVPIWRAYCERHKLGFFLQSEPLSTEVGFEWTKPRTLMELVQRTTWRYVFFVDASSLPADLNKNWAYAIKRHMRHKRFPNDRVMDRFVFCPWDCEEEYKRAYEEGACYGPLLTGCIFWAKKRQTLRLLQSWYLQRREPLDPNQALVQGLKKVKERNWSEIFFKDVQGEIGRKRSSFLASFSYDASYGWNIRDQIHDYIAGHAELRKLANHVSAGRPTEL